MDIPFEVDDELAWENPEGFNTVDDGISSKGRWYTTLYKVITNGDLYYRINWFEGNTESQDIEPDVTVTQVYPKTVSTVIYVENPDA